MFARGIPCVARRLLFGSKCHQAVGFFATCLLARLLGLPLGLHTRRFLSGTAFGLALRGRSLLGGAGCNTFLALFRLPLPFGLAAGKVRVVER